MLAVAAIPAWCCMVLPADQRCCQKLQTQAEQLGDSHSVSTIRLQSLCHHLQLLSARPECRTRDGRVVRAVRRVFRSSPEQPRFQFDWQRTARLAAFGGAIAGPLGHVWFQALDANIMPATPRRRAPSASNPEGYPPTAAAHLAASSCGLCMAACVHEHVWWRPVCAACCHLHGSVCITNTPL